MNELKMQNAECRMQNERQNKRRRSWLFFSLSVFSVFYILHSTFYIAPVVAADPFSVIGAVKPGDTCADEECRKAICPCVERDFTTGECKPGSQMQCFSGKCGTNAQEAGLSKLPCNYTLDDIVLTGVKIAQFVFGITGSLMLLFFVYGGFKMLTAGGNAEHIQAAQKVLTAAVIGGIIILGAALMVRFVVKDVLQIEVTGGPNVGTIQVGGGQ